VGRTRALDGAAADSDGGRLTDMAG
jgi:hypothetical protein